MALSSVSFLFLLLPVILLLYILLPGKWRTAKNIFLTAAGLIFYAWGDGIYVLLLVGSALLNWLVGLIMHRFAGRKKPILAAAIVLNIAVLFLFKYTAMLIKTLDLIPGIELTNPDIHLPIGISFFTFQALSYIIDIYRDPQLTQKNFGRLLLYLSFFPKLLQGPIVKYRDFAPQLESRSESAALVCRGIRRFAAGLSKKILIADMLARTADSIFGDAVLSGSCLCAWIGALSYLGQIYFDFSGYSDMAIGLGQMFGFSLPENFSYPYAASGMRDFWRRWHISLSAWFTDYVYIPLGGSRRGKLITYRNILIVFLLTGIWHGAEYTFLIWGIFNGILVALEHSGMIPVGRGRGAWWCHIYTFFAVTVGFVIFRSPSLGAAGSYLVSMFSFHTAANGAARALEFLSPYFIFILFSAFVFSMPVVPWLKKKLSAAPPVLGKLAQASSYIAALVLIVLCTMSLAADSFSPFIYTRF